MIDLKKAKRIAKEAAITAGKFLLTHQHQVVIKKQKDAVDIQTDADLKAEKICIDLIQKSFPTHNILSEEIGFIDNKSKYTWVIDPLDGTKEYLRQIPLWGTILSLETSTETLISSAYFPTTNELYLASKKTPTTYNSKITKLSKEKELSKSFIYTHPPTRELPQKISEKIWIGFKKITENSYRLRSHANDTWVLSWLSRGGLEGYWLPSAKLTKWYDISPGIFIAQQAGAKVTDRFGKPIKLGDLSKGLVVTNNLIHDQLLKIIN